MGLILALGAVGNTAQAAVSTTNNDKHFMVYYRAWRDKTMQGVNTSLPDENWIDGSEVQVDGYQVENGYYQLDNGKKVRAICVYHPSVGYSWDFWYKVIMNTL